MSKQIETIENKLRNRYVLSGKVEDVKIKKILNCCKVIEIFSKDLVDNDFATKVENEAKPFTIIWRNRYGNNS